MKTFTTRFFSVLLALTLALGMCLTAFAAETGDGSITVKNAQSNVTYTAYQIFELTLADTDSESDGYEAYAYSIQTSSNWWSVVLGYMDTTFADSSGVYSAKGITLTPAAGVSGTYVVEVGNNFSAASFAAYLLANIPNGEEGTALTYNSGTGTATASNLPLGYYLVVGNDGTQTLALAELTTTDTDAYIYDKNVIEFDKTQKTDGDYADTTLSVEIGDTVYYQITGKVPDYTGYSNYVYLVSDTLSDGLTLDVSLDADGSVTAGGVKVTVNGTEVTLTVLSGLPDGISISDENPVVATDSYTNYGNWIFYDVDVNRYVLALDVMGVGDGNSAMEINSDITLAYSATVNKDAVDTENNGARLTYSSNPADTSATQYIDEEVEVYTAKIAVYKYDSAADNSPLADASFVLYKLDTDGETKLYYQYNVASDGTVSVEWVSDMAYATVLTTDSSGALTGSDSLNNITGFVGLEDGTYYLLETAAPNGYNLLTSAVKVVIDGASKEATETASASYTYNKDVANSAGTILPATGGMGTTLIYTVGVILVLGAGLALVVRRRMRVG